MWWFLVSIFKQSCHNYDNYDVTLIRVEECNLSNNLKSVRIKQKIILFLRIDGADVSIKSKMLLSLE